MNVTSTAWVLLQNTALAVPPAWDWGSCNFHTRAVFSSSPGQKAAALHQPFASWEHSWAALAVWEARARNAACCGTGRCGSEQREKGLGVTLSAFLGLAVPKVPPVPNCSAIPAVPALPSGVPCTVLGCQGCACPSPTPSPWDFIPSNFSPCISLHPCPEFPAPFPKVLGSRFPPEFQTKLSVLVFSASLVSSPAGSSSTGAQAAPAPLIPSPAARSVKPHRLRPGLCPSRCLFSLADECISQGLWARSFLWPALRVPCSLSKSHPESSREALLTRCGWGAWGRCCCSCHTVPPVFPSPAACAEVPALGLPPWLTSIFGNSSGLQWEPEQFCRFRGAL